MSVPLTPWSLRSLPLPVERDAVRWLDRLLHRPGPDGDEPEESVSAELARARAARLEAERKLAATRRTGFEVARVAEVARKLRAHDEFTASIDQLFGRRG